MGFSNHNKGRNGSPSRGRYKRHLKAPRDIFGAHKSSNNFQPRPRFDSGAGAGSHAKRWWGSLTGWGKMAFSFAVVLAVAALVTVVVMSYNGVGREEVTSERLKTSGFYSTTTDSFAGIAGTLRLASLATRLEDVYIEAVNTTLQLEKELSEISGLSSEPSSVLVTTVGTRPLLACLANSSYRLLAHETPGEQEDDSGRLDQRIYTAVKATAEKYVPRYLQYGLQINAILEELSGLELPDNLQEPRDKLMSSCQYLLGAIQTMLSALENLETGTLESLSRAGEVIRDARRAVVVGTEKIDEALRSISVE